MRRAATAIVVLLVWCAGVQAQTPPSLVSDRTFAGGTGRIADIAFSNDGRILAVVGSQGNLAVWDTQNGTPIRQVAVSQEPAARVAFGGPSTLVVGTERGGVSTVSLLTGQAREVARHGRAAITAVALAPDGSSGASGDASGDIMVWSVEPTAPAERLREDTRREAIVFLAFVSPTTLVSINKDLAITTWDVPKRRSLRRGTVQIEALGRAAEFSAATTDASATQLAIASQYTARQRAGAAVTTGLARPEDIRRTNVIVPYALESGIAGDPIALGDFLAERMSLSPGGCYSIFSSNYRDQPRLHIWSLIKQGQDLVRQELTGRAAAVALDPTGRYVAAGFPNGEVRTWRISGVTASDCSMVRNTQTPAAPRPGPRIVLGSEATPLFRAGSGFKVAVMRFDVTGMSETLGDGVAEMVGGELSNSQSVVVVERGAVERVVKEMQLQSSGLTAADAVKVGRGLNVQKVVFGGVRRFGESTFVITARVVDVETQQVQGSREVTCENCSEADLPAAVRSLRTVIVP